VRAFFEPVPNMHFSRAALLSIVVIPVLAFPQDTSQAPSIGELARQQRGAKKSARVITNEDLTFPKGTIPAVSLLENNATEIVEAVQQFAMVLVLPVLASSAFVPTSSMLGWLQVVAANQPITQAVDAVRTLLLGEPVGDHLELTLVWFGAILAAAFATASWLFARRARSPA